MLKLFSQTTDPLSRLISEGPSGFIQTAFEQLRRLLEPLPDAFALGFAIGIVEFLGQDGLARLRLGDRFLHIFEEILERLALGLPILRERIFRIRIGLGSENGVFPWLCLALSSGGCRFIGHGAAGHPLLQLLLASLERIGLIEQFSQVLLQAGRGLLSQGLSRFLHHLLRAGARCESGRGLLLLDGLGRLLQLLSSLLHLLPRILHALLIGFAVHAIENLVGILQQFLLAIAKPFQLLFDLLFLRFGLCLLKGEIEFAELIVEILLSAREFIEAAHDLPHLALLGLIGRFGLALGFVPILVVIEFQLLDLLLSRPLSGGLRATRSLRLLGLADFEFARTQLQQPLVGGSFLLHRLA